MTGMHFSFSEWVSRFNDLKAKGHIPSCELAENSIFKRSAIEIFSLDSRFK